MENNKVKLVGWGDGDRTVGDGTFHFDLVVDAVPPDMLDHLKERIKEDLSEVWDLAPRYVHVMTEEEFAAYTKAEDEVHT